MIREIRKNADGTNTAIGGDLHGRTVEKANRTCSVCGEDVQAWTDGTEWDTMEENQCDC